MNVCFNEKRKFAIALIADDDRPRLPIIDSLATIFFPHRSGAFAQYCEALSRFLYPPFI